MSKPSRRKSQVNYPKVNLRNLYRKMDKGGGNPYGIWDSGLNPRYLPWELYKQPICQLSDERPYSTRALQHLVQYGQLIDGFAEIEDITQEGDDSMPTFFGDGSAQNQRFLYRDNLITATLRDDMTYTLDFMYPVSKSCAHGDFGKWILERKGESKVSVLIQRNGTLVANKISFTPPVISDLDLNYGTGFQKTYDKIVEKMKAKNAGIYIFSGDPGTGKSVFIKHLTSIIDREFLFVPVGLSNQISDPSFISLLLSKKEAVIVLEDAEKAVQQRGDGYGDDSAVANLLNVSDGLLSSILNISILVTFNAPKHTIDKALLRKGRLAYEYHFGPLNKEDAQRLANHLKKDITVAGPMTIADVYGANDDTGVPEVKTSEFRQMGFHTLLPVATSTPDCQKDKEKVAKN